MESTFLSPQEVADLLQIKKNTVYDMIKRGDLKATKLGKQFRIARNDLYAYMGITPEPVSAPQNIVICGQDVLLDVLCALFNRRTPPHVRAYRSAMGSYRGLYEMYQHADHIATCHIWDGKTDSYNLPYVERMLPGEQLSVFHLLDRWQGLYVKRGNPKEIRSFSDLSRPDVRMINRDKGSGIRIFIDEMIKVLQLDADQFNGYEEEADSHMIAATAVAMGNADVAIGNEKGCRQVEGVEFIPLKKESYDIVFRKADLKKPEYQLLLELIRSDEFKKEAEAIQGYDVTDMGKQLL